jgi:hypothetical protein
VLLGEVGADEAAAVVVRAVEQVVDPRGVAQQHRVEVAVAIGEAAVHVLELVTHLVGGEGEDALDDEGQPGDAPRGRIVTGHVRGARPPARCPAAARRRNA